MSTTEPAAEDHIREARSLPGAAEAYYAHKGCGGTTIWDLSGGFCMACHAEGLDADDVEHPPCPGGCGCRLGTGDADRSECGCDEGCCGD